MGRIADIAAEFHSAIANSDPQSMIQVRQDLNELPQALADLASGLRTLQERAIAHWPMHPAVTQSVGTVHGGLVSAADASKDVPSAFAAMHEEDLNRHDRPRPGEAMWDVSRAS